MRFGVGQGLELGMFGQGLTLRIWIEKEIDRGPLITTVSASNVLTHNCNFLHLQSLQINAGGQKGERN